MAVALWFFAWGRWRADLVAVVALVAAVLFGAVPADHAFDGFADPAMVAIGAVMVLSGAIRKSGLFEGIIRVIEKLPSRPGLRAAVVGGLAAFAASFMTNADVLQSVVPGGQTTARQGRRFAGLRLELLACMAALGSTATLIGSVPNLLISSLRRATLGGDVPVFGFTPVGAALATVGVLLVSVVWHFSAGRPARPAVQDTANLPGGSFASEVLVPPDSPLVGQSLQDLQARTQRRITVSAVVREDLRRLQPRPDWRIEPSDILVLACEPEALQRLLEGAGVSIVGRPSESLDPERTGVIEAVIAPDSELIGLSQVSSRLEERFRLSLLAVGRPGFRPLIRLRRVTFRAGDVLVLQGELDVMAATVTALGCLPLAERRLRLGRHRQVLAPLGILAGALALAATGALPIAVALLCGVVLLVLGRIMSLAELYADVSWPVLVQVGALLPLSAAVRSSGAAASISGWLAPLAGASHPGLWVAAVLVAALASAALVRGIPAALVLSPVALSFAGQTGLPADPLLMAVAVGTTCDLLAAAVTVRDRSQSGVTRDVAGFVLPLLLLVAIVGSLAIALVWRLQP